MANKIVVPDSHPWPGKSADVRGLSQVPTEENPRQGQLIFKDPAGSPHTLQIVADHAYPIPDGSYTLIGCSGMLSPNLYHWAVGQLREDGKFEKLSVFSSANDEQVRPSELGLENKVKMILC
ncbi:hypothetical protein ARMGADRAFT_1018087 [Armillaria gallica]|uniref:Uncharacterized protein n=1 Tax=Armillaria gallica TaxID=47427 RepID=A0A2H3CUA9_ARMGA|nr:hypothetical protein ARMGADRAFT_1018087 [Armillaria gallica]